MNVEGKKERKNQIQRRITSGIILLYDGVAGASREDISCTYETFILVKIFYGMKMCMLFVLPSSSITRPPVVRVLRKSEK